MPSRVNIFASTVLRGLRMLFSLIVIGLSVTLVKNHNNHGGEEGYPGSPTILPLSTGIGALSLVAAVFSLAIAWTNCLRGYIEMMVDVVVIAANVVAGTILAINLKGSRCDNASYENRVGSGGFPFTGSLGSIAILNGGCKQDYLDTWYCYNTSDPRRWVNLNKRCKQSQSDAIFMFLTVVVLFATIALTFLRTKKSY